MVYEQASADPSQCSAITSIASKIGCSAQTLSGWIKRRETDTGQRPGVTTEEHARVKALEGEVKELRRANEILRKASAYFVQAELDRRRTLSWPSLTPIATSTESIRSVRCCRPLRRGTTSRRRVRPIRCVCRHARRVATSTAHSVARESPRLRRQGDVENHELVRASRRALYRRTPG